jgi:hypothetical protein
MNLAGINLNTDILVLLTFALIVTCGVLLGHHKVRIFAMSVYVGIVLATELGTVIYNFLNTHALGYFTLGQVRIFLMIAPIIILELGRRERYKRGARGNLIMTLVLSVLVAALIISSIVGLLEDGSRQEILAQSSVVWPLYQFRLWWVAAVPVAVLLESFMQSKDH